MNKLKEKLEEKSLPPWSYSDYIELALYDAEVGYYMRDSIKLGKEGDFYTSNHVHPVFQRTFGRFFLDVLEKEGIPNNICEWGAGDGTFAKNVLEYIKEQDPELLERLTYIIIEASVYHQQKIREILEPFSHLIQIFSSIDDAKVKVPSFQGIIFSNELLDALPVHLVEQKNGSLMEVKINWENGKFVEEVVQNENRELENWIKEYGPKIPDGHRTEVCLAMKNWLYKINSWMEKGIIVTVDYGYTNEELMMGERREGSLRGYYKHELIKSPLMYPGQMDITAHVQWDAFRRIGLDIGFKEILHDRQDRFLLKGGLFTFLKEGVNLNPFSDEFKQNRAIQSLVHPNGISTSFHVNILGKGIKNPREFGVFTEDPYKR